jgi:hypothetical protein
VAQLVHLGVEARRPVAEADDAAAQVGFRQVKHHWYSSRLRPQGTTLFNSNGMRKIVVIDQ